MYNWAVGFIDLCCKPTPVRKGGFHDALTRRHPTRVERELTERRYYRDPIVQSYGTQSTH